MTGEPTGAARAPGMPPADAHRARRRLLLPDGREHAGAAVTAELLAASLASAGPARQALGALGVRGRARAIARVGAWWAAACAAPELDRAVADALARGGEQAELSVEMLRWGIATTARTWTEDALVALVERELGSAAAVDAAPAAPAVTLAVPPQICLQVLARTVPPAGWQSMALAWLLGAAVVVRPSAHLVELVRAFVASLARLAPELAAVTWMSCSDAQDAHWRQVLARHADAIVVHGSDEAVSAWGAVARPDALLVPHGHKTSAAFLAVEGLDEPALSAHLRGLALDLCAWDQLGCLSPVTLYVAQGGAASPDEVARRLAQDQDALPAVERALPPGPWSKAVLAERTLFLRARLLEARAYASQSAHVLVYPAPGPLEPSCLHRVLLVRPIASLDVLVAVLSQSAPHLQGLAVGGSAATRAELAVRLAPAGLSRACAPGELQRPPVGWSHDGRGCVRPLVRWVDLT